MLRRGLEFWFLTQEIGAKMRQKSTCWILKCISGNATLQHLINGKIANTEKRGNLGLFGFFSGKILILFPNVTQLSPSAPDLSQLIPTVPFIKLAILSDHAITSLPIRLAARPSGGPPAHPSVRLSARPSISLFGCSSIPPTTRL